MEQILKVFSIDEYDQFYKLGENSNSSSVYFLKYGKNKVIIKQYDSKFFAQVDQKILLEWNKTKEKGVCFSQVTKIVECEENTCFVMIEYLEGENLLSLVREGKVSEQEKREKETKMGEILRTMHATDILVEGYGQIVQFKEKFVGKYQNFEEFFLNDELFKAGLEIAGQIGVRNLSKTRERMVHLQNLKTTVLHGDFRAGNILMSKKGELSVIDPNCYISHHLFDLAYSVILDFIYESFPNRKNLFSHPILKGYGLENLEEDPTWKSCLFFQLLRMSHFSNYSQDIKRNILQLFSFVD